MTIMTISSSGQPCSGGSGRFHATVSGRVQGVGYRDFVSSAASRLGCSGYVRNMADRRTVEVVAEGACDSLRQLLAALHRGPIGASVQRVTVVWDRPSGEFDRFTVRV